jgi:hypothetical protein
MYEIFVIILLVIIFISFVTIKAFGILVELQEYLLYTFLILLFWFIGEIYNDNYSIEQLIKELQLQGYGTLDYKLFISKNKGVQKCKINGTYDNYGRLNYELDHNNLYCQKIINETNNLSPIAHWDTDINLSKMGKSKKDESCESDSDCKKGLICYEKGSYVDDLSLYEELTEKDDKIKHDKIIQYDNKCQNLSKLI